MDLSAEPTENWLRWLGPGGGGGGGGGKTPPILALDLSGGAVWLGDIGAARLSAGLQGSGLHTLRCDTAFRLCVSLPSSLMI